MTPEFGIVAAVVLLASAVLTSVMRRISLSQGVLDVPNERSSHSVPTPRGGGVAIVATTTLGVAALAVLDMIDTRLLLAITVGGLAVATVGYIDDRRAVSAGIRLAVHFIAAVWALACLGDTPQLRFGEHLILSGWASYVLGALGIVWAINLFNFMDGIDGIAASESMFVSATVACFAIVGGVSGATPAASIVFGTACLGFLFWNWPPAKIFMGDAGSGYLGYFIGVTAIFAARESDTAPAVTLIAAGVFFVDATVTVIRRLIRGERVFEAHRSHAYQWLARRWRSHRRVTLLVQIVNVSWLLPCAWLATRFPSVAVWWVVVAWTPLIVGVIAAGAGQRETAAAR